MFCIAIHGGAGSLDASKLTPEQENLYYNGLNAALDAGNAVLRDGGSALDAVQHAVMALEDDPLFNAGKGSVFNFDGVHEMDAAIMCGKTREAGAVAAVRHVRNPVLLARKIMNDARYVLLTGEGALDYARQAGVELEEMSYFSTPHQYVQLRETKMQRFKKASDTVGAVARDMHGNLAAASSTGGLTNKRFGRVGDSPVIGAGTYADNASCAVCCTGEGEYFVRLVSAYDVSAMLRYRGISLEDACRIAIGEKLTALGGEGGLIAVDYMGNIGLFANCTTMPRGWIGKDGQRGTAIRM